jgi:hypothetical protein
MNMINILECSSNLTKPSRFYFQVASHSTIFRLELQKHLQQIGFIISKFYEKESDQNKRIGVEVSSLFSNISKLFGDKVLISFWT